MALTRCPECQREVSDRAYACPGCGHPLREAGIRRDPAVPGSFRPAWTAPYEYKSQKTVLGLPLIHIVYGPTWLIGLRPAKGFIAIGNVALGVIAVGGVGLGLITLSGIGLGLVAIGGIAFGLGIGLGGIATGYLAVGGLAIGVYAIGGLGIGVHTLMNDPHLLDSFKKLFPR